MTITEFVRQYKITMTCDWADNNPNMSDQEWARSATHYKCVLRKGKSQTTVFYSLGVAYTTAPEVEGVLDTLASDASGYDNAHNFEEWAADLGLDTDSRRAERIYKVTERQTQKLQALLGLDAYEKLLYHTERL